MHSKEFEEEYEILKSIYSEIEMGEERTANDEVIVSIVLFPSTCDDDETRYVTLCLEFSIPPAYPSQPPTILFRNPRGLSEAKLTDLHANLMRKCMEDMLDTPMLFQIIDTVQEFLTTNNLPASDCPICLNSFHPADVFYRSKCFHYFHSQCLGKFLQNIIKQNNNVEDSTITQPSDSKAMAPQFLCPVCREELDPSTIDIPKFLDSPAPFGETEESFSYANNETDAKGSLAKVSAEWLEHRENMKSLYEKQEKQGGIIDLNQQLGKLLVISTPTPANDETESVESMESTGSPDSGTGTSSLLSKVSLSSSDTSHASAISSSSRPNKSNPGVRSSANSSSHGKGPNRDGHHYYYRSHNNFRHANHRSSAVAGPHRSSHGVAEKNVHSAASSKDSLGGTNKVSDVAVPKHTRAESKGTKQAEHGQHKSKDTNNGILRQPQRGNQSARSNGTQQHETAKISDADGRRSEPLHKHQQVQDEQKKIPHVEGAASGLSTTDDRMTDQSHPVNKDASGQSHGRIRNFRQHFHPRGHHNYNNHHSHGYGGARKYDQARQNYADAEDQ